MLVIVLLLYCAPCSRKARNRQPTQFIVLQPRQTREQHQQPGERQTESVARASIQSEDNSGSVCQLSRI